LNCQKKSPPLEHAVPNKFEHVAMEIIRAHDR